MMNIDRKEKEEKRKMQNQIHEFKMTTSTWLSFNLVNEIKPTKQIGISMMLV